MYKFRLLIISIIMFFLAQYSYAQTEVEYITFVDNYSENTSTANVLSSILPKTERVSSSAGVITPQMEGVPDSIATCIYAAIDIWESLLGNKEPIYLKFLCSDLEDDTDVTTQVLYTNYNGTFYPSSMYYNRFATRETGANDIDANIIINTNADWDCSHNNVVLSDRKNMTYAMLRAIAISLGFGSSVTENTSGIGFSVSQGYTIFDNLVLSTTGTRLNNITNVGNRKNTALENFVQRSDGSEIFVANITTNSRKMYAPNIYEPNKSLVYLDNESSLMHYDLKEGNKCLQVDTVTVNILKELGWELQSVKSIQIVGDGIDETGIASAYESHKFQIQNNTQNTITDASWTMSLPLKNGGESVVYSSSGSLEFEVPVIKDLSIYQTNINGDIYGYIKFTGMINGEEVSDSYRISLELKPQIKSVTILKKESNTPLNSYNVYYTVEYVGNDELTISIEEDYSSELRTSYVKEPFLAHVVSKNISSNYYAWIDIKVTNKYGSDISTIELSPLESSGIIPVEKLSSDINAETDRILVHDMEGRLIGDYQSLNELSKLKQGAYILNLYKNDSIVKTAKYLKR